VGRGEQLVARAEFEGAHHRVHGRRRIWDKHQVSCLRTDKLRQRISRNVQSLFIAPPEKLHGLGLHASPEFCLGLQYRLWACAKGAVIQEYCFWSQTPVSSKRRRLWKSQLLRLVTFHGLLPPCPSNPCSSVFIRARVCCAGLRACRFHQL